MTRTDVLLLVLVAVAALLAFLVLPTVLAHAAVALSHLIGA